MRGVARAPRAARQGKGQPEEAARTADDGAEIQHGGWHNVRRARESGLPEGLAGSSCGSSSSADTRYGRYAVRHRRRGLPQVTRRALEELEALHEECAWPRTGGAAARPVRAALRHGRRAGGAPPGG
ncbi:hypothetical protein [Streptantibioticus ferralitis]|uniref:Uncharacterized protein n=1 Tax=Streptantibioticus ferralitis TaxID=236510 RepID=A0ABT5Z4N4_9ACTN|nr:hypothetical protein [Streptantibioticus ferralitis]MDF2258784.1 hypothetical protein [Streptantibioticus ferralitis]